MPNNRKRWPSPDELLKALVDAQLRHGCRYLEALDAKALADTGGLKETKAMMARAEANSKKQG